MRALRALCAVVPLVAGACGPQWVIVRQATPNPLLGKHAFTIEPVRYDGLMIGKKTEAEYLAGKNPEQQASFQGDKQGVNEKFNERANVKKGAFEFAAGTTASADGFLVRPVIEFIEPGTFNGFVNIPTEVRMRLFIVDTQGQPLDEVQLRTGVVADIYRPSSGQRMRIAAEQLAEQMVHYLTTRTVATQ